MLLFRVVVNVNSKDTKEVVVCKNGCETIVDTSSNSIIGPVTDIDQIHDAINAREFVLHRYTVSIFWGYKRLPWLGIVRSSNTIIWANGIAFLNLIFTQAV